MLIDWICSVSLDSNLSVFANSITAEMLRVERAPAALSSSAVVAEPREPAALVYTCSIDVSFCLKFSVLRPTRIR